VLKVLSFWIKSQGTPASSPVPESSPESTTDGAAQPAPARAFQSSGEENPMSILQKLTFDPMAELRQKRRQMLDERARAMEQLLARGVAEWELARHLPSFDFARFADLICGAKGKRTGKPCPSKALYANGRCRHHGGLSTGPKTPEGRAKAGRNGKGKPSGDP
jgi:hypothetical protein